MATYDFHIVNWKIKNPLSHILAFVYPEQVKCFNSLGQLSLSAQGLKYECTSDWSEALINQSPPQVKWHLLRRLSSSSMKMFTTITEFIADERSHQTGTTSVSSVQYRCSAIDSVTQNATEILRTSYMH